MVITTLMPLMVTDTRAITTRVDIRADTMGVRLATRIMGITDSETVLACPQPIGLRPVLNKQGPSHIPGGYQFLDR